MKNVSIVWNRQEWALFRGLLYEWMQTSEL